MLPLISVIIPAYNAAQTIIDALETTVQQIYPHLEIIVIDDQSTDQTKEIVQSYVQRYREVKYFVLPYVDQKRFDWKGENINAGWLARNFGVNKSQGEWVTFQDADDASFLNRIMIQYKLAQRFKSHHICIDWQKFKKEHLSFEYNLSGQKAVTGQKVISSHKILQLARRTKGKGFEKLGKAHQYIPFVLKKSRPLRPFFFPSWGPYPCAGNAPLVKREVFRKVSFRPRAARVWSSARGRGADRDFNFQVAEKFQDSVCVKIPLYLWRVDHQNPDYF